MRIKRRWIPWISAVGTGWLIYYFTAVVIVTSNFEPWGWAVVILLWGAVSIFLSCLLFYLCPDLEKAPLWRKILMIILLICTTFIVGGVSLWILVEMVYYTTVCYREMIDRLLTMGGLLIENLF